MWRPCVTTMRDEDGLVAAHDRRSVDHRAFINGCVMDVVAGADLSQR